MEQNSCYIVCRGNDSKIHTSFSPIIETSRCEIAVVGLSTYYSYPNITDKNNKFVICDEKLHHDIALPKGCYEIDDINKVWLERGRGSSQNRQWFSYSSHTHKYKK